MEHFGWPDYDIVKLNIGHVKYVFQWPYGVPNCSLSITLAIMFSWKHLHVLLN